ncbi:MAG: hypothetical protein ACRDZY_18150, partial [Acidimicrobiales bacterium]
VVFGHMGFLQHVAVLGALPVGVLGAWRLSRPLGSRRARVVAMVVYAAVPLPYGALGTGRWEAMVAYAGAPWILHMLACSTRIEPFGSGPSSTGQVVRRVIAIAVLAAALSAFVPVEVVLVALSAAGLVAGSLLAGRVRASLRAGVMALAGGVGAVALTVPWTLGLLQPGANLGALTGPATSMRVGLGQLLALRAGGVGVTPLAWGLVAAAALPLLIGKGWRLAWATRSWGVAVVCWAVAFLGGRGLLGGTTLPVGALLAPAAAAMALSAGLGVVAFEQDLPAYRFGWRQGMSLLAAVGVVVGTFSVLGAAVSGRWGLPSQGFDQALSWMPAKAAQGDFRVLWLGRAGALPLGSWSMGSHLAYAT